MSAGLFVLGKVTWLESAPKHWNFECRYCVDIEGTATPSCPVFTSLLLAALWNIKSFWAGLLRQLPKLTSSSDYLSELHLIVSKQDNTNVNAATKQTGRNQCSQPCRRSSRRISRSTGRDLSKDIQATHTASRIETDKHRQTYFLWILRHLRCRVSYRLEGTRCGVVHADSAQPSRVVRGRRIPKVPRRSYFRATDLHCTSE